MLAFDNLKNNVLSAIADRIGEKLSACSFQKMKGPWQLAESIAITGMPSHVDAAGKARPVFRGYWMHLLKNGDRYVGYAISTPIGPRETDWMIESVSVAKAADQIARAIGWVEQNFTAGLVRLLIDPKHQLHAFTVENNKQMRVVVAHLPRKIELQKRKVYEWQELFELLSKQSPVAGVTSRGRTPRKRSATVSPPRIINRRRAALRK